MASCDDLPYDVIHLVDKEEHSLMSGGHQYSLDELQPEGSGEAGMGSLVD